MTFTKTPYDNRRGGLCQYASVDHVKEGSQRLECINCNLFDLLGFQTHEFLGVHAAAKNELAILTACQFAGKLSEVGRIDVRGEGGRFLVVLILEPRQFPPCP